MASRNFYIQLIIRILFLTLTAIVLGFSAVQQAYIWLFVAVVALVIQVFSIIQFINRTNRKIAYFFDAIKNEDFTLRFPERVAIKSFKELNQSLNRVNGLIQEVHLQLQIREKYYQEILKQANIGIMTYNEKGHILYANPTIEKLLNHSPLNHIQQLKRVDPGLYEVFKSFRPFERKLFQRTNERQQIQLALKSTSVVLKDDPLLLVVVQDIHEELEEKETDSWIRLIRVLTHEIMNTITPITSISDSILKYYQKDDTGKVLPMEADKMATAAKGLEVIRGQGNDLMEFVQSYRSFLNVPKPDKELVSVRRLFEKVKVLTESGLKTHIDFSWGSTPEDLEFFMDEKQMTQVLVNLIKNAIHSLENRDSGTITVTAGVDENNRKFLEVRDNGPGISPEVLEEIFVPFFTTKTKGTGIGLSLSRQIVQLHGGILHVHSIPDRETVFSMKF
jgi:nitrogen fixation/metabolism regulation signal transduction histidine kinase